MKTKTAFVPSEILIFLIMIVLTSAVVLFLVNVGILQVKGQNEVNILNTEFIPYQREGNLVIKEFKFCEKVNENYECVNPKNTFKIGEKVYFRFIVSSSPSNGEVMLTENYRVQGPTGKVLLDADEKSNYHFEKRTAETEEIITLKHFLITEEGDQEGEYTVDLIVENQLLNKKVTLSRMFELTR